MLSDLVHGEVIGLARDRTQESLSGLLREQLEERQRASVKAVCTDMHQPYVNAVGEVLPKAEVVFDKFHVLQHAAAALDEVRRQEFFRAGEVMREFGRGKRWLLLRRWKTIRGSKRQELRVLYARRETSSLSFMAFPSSNKERELLLISPTPLLVFHSLSAVLAVKGSLRRAQNARP